MKTSIFEYKDYKKYLRDVIRGKPNEGRGVKSALAVALSCQNAYISRVIDGDAHFSMEQAQKVNGFLPHSKEEGRFFLLLILYNRAGSHDLKRELAEQINESLEKRLILKDRLDVKKTLSRTDQAIYYSSWYYTAIHFIVMIPGIQTKEEIGRHLGLSPKTVAMALEFLESVGLVKAKGNRYQTGITRLHLEGDSPMISKHHTNWRVRAIRAVEQQNNDELHYSSVITVSKDDAYKVKSIMVKAIEEIRAVVKDSKEERLCCYLLDFFDLEESVRR